MATSVDNFSYNDKLECKLSNTANSVFVDENEIIPTVDYMELFSDDSHQRSKALAHLNHACQDFGFFYLINHGVTSGVWERVFKGISDYFDQNGSDEDRRKYSMMDPTDKIRRELRSSTVDNREYIKLVTHPVFHCPPNPPHFSVAMEEYVKGMKVVKIGLGKAISKILGMEEDYIEKAMKLESGFDVSAINLYPPNSESKTEMGQGDHTDPGFFVSLIQDDQNVGGLQIMTHNSGKWINVNMPQNDAIFIILADQLEILTNGKYKSHVHRVVVGNNKVKRISLGTLHGPALEAFIEPSPEFVGDSHSPNYRGAAYKHSLVLNGHHEVDVQTSLDLLRLN